MTAEPAGELAPEEPHVPHRTDLADPGQRLLARIVDTLIVGLPVVAVLLQTVPRSRLDVVAPPLVALLLLAYEAPQIALWGRTPGKRVAGIEVVPADGAERLGAGRALLRAATYNLPIAVRPVPVLGLLAGFFWVVNGAFIYEGARREVPDGARRALHDRIAGTDVVRTRPAAPGSPE